MFLKLYHALAGYLDQGFGKQQTLTRTYYRSGNVLIAPRSPTTQRQTVKGYGKFDLDTQHTSLNAQGADVHQVFAKQTSIF